MILSLCSGLSLSFPFLTSNTSAIRLRTNRHVFRPSAIKSFKYQDESEILQKEFEDLEEKKKANKDEKEFVSLESDKLMMKDITNKKNDTIKNFAVVKTKKKKEKIKTPTQKKIDLKTEELKNKGVKKKKKKKKS